MRCKYCFYNDVAKNRETPSHGAMSLQTAETVVKKRLPMPTEIPSGSTFRAANRCLPGKRFFQGNA
ncbi:MAG: hypothetical protein L6V85_10745 [Clostridiales bacterium]|nr:MAG: hypothetical protein L6V85_10745 [Clostridiales bacterium]